MGSEWIKAMENDNSKNLSPQRRLPDDRQAEDTKNARMNLPFRDKGHYIHHIELGRHMGLPLQRLLLLLPTATVFLFLCNLVVPNFAFCSLNFNLSPMDSLFIRASTGEIRYLEWNGPAQDTLVQMGIEDPQKTISYLIGKLETKNARERQTLIEILKKIKEPAVMPLMNHIQEDQVRESSRLAVHILGEIGLMDSTHLISWGEFLDPLIGLLHNPDWRMRLAVCEALGKIGDVRGVEPLIVALQDSVFLVRKGSAFGLGKILSNLELSTPQSTIGIQHLIRSLGDDSYAVRYPARDALEKIGRPAVPFLIKTLQEKDPITRSLVCDLLGKIGDRKAVGPLKKMLKDEDWGVRVSAREALNTLEKREGEIPDSPIGKRIK